MARDMVAKVIVGVLNAGKAALGNPIEMCKWLIEFFSRQKHADEELQRLHERLGEAQRGGHELLEKVVDALVDIAKESAADPANPARTRSL